MILTTTSTVEGKTVSEYLGVVTGKGVDLESKDFEQAMREAAEKMGADAIVGIQFSFDDGYVCTIGTAVKLK